MLVNNIVYLLNVIRNTVTSLPVLRLPSIRPAARSLTALLYMAMTLSGCASIMGAPKPVLNVDSIIKSYTAAFDQLAITPPQNCDQIREGVNKALTAMDLRYAEFIDDLSVQGKTKATGTDIALTGLGLAGTAVGGAGAKTVFNALSAGIAATNTSIDKNYFYEKTLPALVSKMNADRKAQQLLILKRLHDCTDAQDYPWSEAVHDLTDYYAAGTLLGAIASIAKDAGASQEKSEAEIKNVIVPTLTPSEETDDKTWLRQTFRQPNGAEKIMACWRKVNPDLFKTDANTNLPCAGGTLNAARLINAAECAKDQSKVRSCIEHP